MGILSRLIIGAFAGWIAGLLTGKSRHMSLGGNVVTGIAGGFIGGFIMNLLGGPGVTGLNLYSLFVSIVGAVVFLWIVSAFSHER